MDQSFETGRTAPPRGEATGVEVHGGVVLGLLDAMGPFRSSGLAILEKHGLEDPRLDRWYPLPALLASFEDLLEQTGGSTLAQVGQRVIETSKWPEGVNTFEQASHAMDVSYHMNHRRYGKELWDQEKMRIVEGGLGHDSFIQSDSRQKEAVYLGGTFYPCDFDQGMLRALTRQFKPDGALFVSIDHGADQQCRKRGDLICISVLSW